MPNQPTQSLSPPPNGAAALRERLVARADGAATAPAAPADRRRQNDEPPDSGDSEASYARRGIGDQSPASAVPTGAASSVTAAPVAPAPAGGEPAAAMTGSGMGTASAGLSLNEARGHYRKIYESLKVERPLVSGMINGGDIVGVDADIVTFAVRFQAVADKLAPGTDALTALTATVRAVFGRPYRVHCVQQSDVQDRLRTQPTKESHLLDEALKLGAKPI